MKHMLSSLLSGAAAGISIELLAAILLSSALHLGYIMLCPAWLPECVGGEISRSVFADSIVRSGKHYYQADVKFSKNGLTKTALTDTMAKKIFRRVCQVKEEMV